MENPLDLDTILSDYSEEDTAWILRDSGTGQYVTIPHERYPGRRIFNFFMSSEDAQKVLLAIDAAGNRVLSGRDIYPCEVRLKAALRTLAAADPTNGFVVHTPNEVFEFLNSEPSSR